MTVPLINKRIKFGHVFDSLDLKIGAELGVAAGDFSCQLLNHSCLRQLHSIDRWSDHHNLAEEQHARKRLSVFGERSVVVRSTFENALCLYEDETFDFIYIDGYAHTGQDAGKTLRDWWPKLRRGGVYAGHDYHPRWQATIDQVDKFIRDYWQNPPFLTTADTYPSWWIIKE